MHVFLWSFAIFFVLTSILGYTMLVDAPWWYKMFITPWFWYLYCIILFGQYLHIKIENSFQYGMIRNVMRAFGAGDYEYNFNFTKPHKRSRFWRW